MRKDFTDIIARLNKLSTEAPNSASSELDTLTALEIATLINDEDAKTPKVVRSALPEIARAAEIAAESLRNDGRLIYVGAGTSGRLGVLDASECPPTFGADPNKIIGLIAGGPDALIHSSEGVEDNVAQALADIEALGIGENDCVIGITASGRTPYVLAALKKAKSVGSKTILVICNHKEGLEIEPDIVIALPVGPELITGSTRMKSGTVTKMTLNTITTTAMVALGKTYGNLMVDVQATSDKLSARARKMLIDMFDLTYERSDELLLSSGGSVKVAIVMETLGIDRQTAIKALDENQGFVRKALKSTLSS